MTIHELHKILDDDNNIITVNELRQIIYELKRDVFGEYYNEYDKKNVDNYKLAFYFGEINAFQIVLDLCEHII